MSDIDTAVVDGLKVLDPNGRLEKLPRGSTLGAAVFDPLRKLKVLPVEDLGSAFRKQIILRSRDERV